MTLFDGWRRRLRRWRVHARRFGRSPTGRRVRTAGRYLFVAGILGYLLYQFTEIGWERVWRSLPRTPWFYVILGVTYVTLPVIESVLYGQVWGTRFWSALPVFFRKRVLNNDVVGYSGEVYLYWWARRYEDLDDLFVLRTIKDNTIVSALTSTVLAIGILAALFLAGEFAVLEPYIPTSSTTWWALGAAAALVGGVGLWLRGVIFSLSVRFLALFALLHTVRFLLINAFQVLQWKVVLPEVPMEAWFTLVGVYIVVHQIPILPSRDLVFVGAGVQLSTWLGLSPAAIGGMLLVKSVIDKALNLIVFALGGWLAPEPSAVSRDGDGTIDTTEIARIARGDVSVPDEPSG